MYEFSSEEVRRKFKETEYGRKTNKWLYISLSIALFFIVLEIVLYFLGKEGIVNLNIYLERCLYCLFSIFLLTACYFDGKRDGAIEQFKRSLKK